MKSPLIGILALQGAFAKHQETLTSINVASQLVRKPEELEGCDGLIIPGGESSTMSNQIDFIEMRQALLSFAQSKPVFGTCAGLILMASSIEQGGVEPFGLLDISVCRNGYGRQYESFAQEVAVQLSGKAQPFHAVFIRAPRIRSCGPRVQVLASLNGEPILVRQGPHLAAAFHPELTKDPLIHRYFISMSF